MTICCCCKLTACRQAIAAILPLSYLQHLQQPKQIERLTLWAVRTAEEARDSRGDMGCGVRFIIALKRE